MEEHPSKRFKGAAVQDDIAVVQGYVTKVSSIKISKNGKQYFNAVVQSSNEAFHKVISYKTQLHGHFLRFAQGRQAVNMSNIRKACSKYF